MIWDGGVFFFLESGTVADGFLRTVFFLPAGCEDLEPSSVWASGENWLWRLVEFFIKFAIFVGLTPDGDPSLGCKNPAILTHD